LFLNLLELETEICPTVCDSKRSDDLVFTTTLNVSFWHKAKF
jgi:hypothetical protein